MSVASRRQVRSALKDLADIVPAPWDVEELVANLSRRRHQRIELVPWTFGSGDIAPSGVWLCSRQADYIFFDTAASPTGREQIIGHELGISCSDTCPSSVRQPEASSQRSPRWSA